MKFKVLKHFELLTTNNESFKNALGPTPGKRNIWFD